MCKISKFTRWNEKGGVKKKRLLEKKKKNPALEWSLALSLAN